MGIRIHKALGYGLIDLETDDDYNVTDDRISKECCLFSPYDEAEDRWTLEGFKKFYAENIGEEFNDWELLKPVLEKYSFPWHWIVNDVEYGCDNVICFIPPGCDRWIRYDDIIDYTEETALSEQVNRYAVLDRGIYPWNGLFWDRRDGRRVKWASEFRRNVNYLKEQGRDDFSLLDSLAQKMEFSGAREAMDNLTPIVPDELRLMLLYLEIFNDPKDIFGLKPMLYVYWSQNVLLTLGSNNLYCVEKTKKEKIDDNSNTKETRDRIDWCLYGVSVQEGHRQ